MCHVFFRPSITEGNNKLSTAAKPIPLLASMQKATIETIRLKAQKTMLRGNLTKFLKQKEQLQMLRQVKILLTIT